MDCNKLITHVSVAIATTLLSACVHSGSRPAILSGEADVVSAKVEERVAVGNPTVATLSLQNGAKLDFVDVGDDHVGVVERKPTRASSVLIPMISKWAASSLEIYLAFRTIGDEVPTALITDHKLHMTRVGNATALPRQLSFQLPDTAGHPEIACDDGGLSDPWSSGWKDAFEGVTDFVATDRQHNVAGYTIYPGHAVFEKTGSNRSTYLGACNGWNSQNITMGFEVHRWSLAAQSWVLVPGTDHTLQIEENSIFYSGHPTGQFRARVRKITEVVPHIGLGGAWSHSFPTCQKLPCDPPER
jgi:hypothetical protein